VLRTSSDKVRSSGGNTENVGGTGSVQGCSHKTFMNGKPHPFNGTNAVVSLRRWIEKGDNIEAYNNRFHELALMCPDLVPNEKKKIERYIRGFPKRIKGNITSLRPTTLHDAINIAHELVEQAVQGKAPRPQLRIGVILGIYQSAIVTTLTTIDNALQSVRGAKELVIRSKTAELRFQVQVLTPCGM
ncbi:hypothetical protein Tco_1325098, partial [Tanacetum coccineum]